MQHVVSSEVFEHVEPAQYLLVDNFMPAGHVYVEHNARAVQQADSAFVL
jgi:hypothetical protein